MRLDLHLNAMIAASETVLPVPPRKMIRLAKSCVTMYGRAAVAAASNTSRLAKRAAYHSGPIKESMTAVPWIPKNHRIELSTVMNSVPISVVPMLVSGIWITVTIKLVTVPNGVAANARRMIRNSTTMMVAGTSASNWRVTKLGTVLGILIFQFFFSMTAYSLVAISAVNMAVNRPDDSKHEAA